MASGHANRTNRPNTWLHRPASQRDVLTCQLGAVHTWHKADLSLMRNWRTPKLWLLLPADARARRADVRHDYPGEAGGVEA